MKKRFKGPFVAALTVASVWLASPLANGADGGSGNSKASGFFNSLGGFLNKSQVVSTNQATNTLQALENVLLSASSTNLVTAETSLKADRLSAFLASQAAIATNSPAATNLTEKVRDWLQARQNAGTNLNATNGNVQRTWASLTNVLVNHVRTNAAGPNAVSISETNVIAKLQAWTDLEDRSRSTMTNHISQSLSAISGLLASRATNQSVTNVAGVISSNKTSSELLSQRLGGLLNRVQVSSNSVINVSNPIPAIDTALSRVAATNLIASNNTILSERLGAFLGGQSGIATNSAAATNLVAKVRDWVDARQSMTNAMATNASSQQAWNSLTNWMTEYAKTNAASSNAFNLSDTNFTARLQEWVTREQQTRTNLALPTNGSMTTLQTLFSSSTNQVVTNLSNNISTNQTPAAAVLRGLGGFFQRKSPATNSGASTNVNPQ